MFGGLALAHMLFFILVLSLQHQIAQGNNGVYALPAIHTILLIGISAVGIYF
ncbi:MAG: hypothetical protein MJ195_03270 [Mycoplasmoidaceae bacterium]|nr:hypothetical protein [Mycoplasmoidaceae bacterium]